METAIDRSSADTLTKNVSTLEVCEGSGEDASAKVTSEMSSLTTPPGGARGEVTVISDISEAALKAQSAAIKDHIILFDTGRVFSEGFKKTYGRLAASYLIFKSLGARALVLPDAVPNNVLGDWVDIDNGTGDVLSLPIAEIGMEDAKLIRRLLQKGPVTIVFSYENHVSGPVKASNVIAEIRGSEKPEEWVIVGGQIGRAHV